MKPIIEVIDKVMSSVETTIIACLSFAALAIGTAQVVMRYVFNTGFHWTEAVFVLFTVTAMLFAGSRAVRDDRHVKVDLLPLAMGPTGQKVLRLVRYVLSLGLVAIYFYAGLQYVFFTKQMGIIAPNSGIPVWITYLIVPITMGFFTVRYVLLLLREAGGEDTGSTEQDEVAAALRTGGDVK